MQDLQAGTPHHWAADPGHDAEEQLQGARPAHAGRHHGHAHLLRWGLISINAMTQKKQ